VTNAEDRAAAIRPHMEVVTSCGCTVGTVDCVENGGVVKLTRRDSADGRHHFVPMAWVDRVDDHVRLSADADQVRRAWQADFARA
jgi:hypothetical protein